jgi:hypothetical protein
VQREQLAGHSIQYEQNRKPEKAYFGRKNWNFSKKINNLGRNFKISGYERRSSIVY